MLYNYNFEIAALFLNLSVAFMYALRRGYRTRSNVMFFTMLVLNFLSSAFNLCTAFTISFPYDYPLWFNYFVNAVFLICHNMTAVTFFAYVCLLTKGRQRIRIESNIWKIVGVFIIVFVATTPLTGLIFYFDDNLTYTHGPCFLCLYLIAFALLVYDLVLMIKYRRRMTSYQAAGMVFYIVAIFVAITMHLMWPAIMTENFAAAVSLALMYMTIENPATYMYKNTYCYNDQALDASVAESLNKGTHFEVVGFAFDDFDEFTRSVSASVVDDLTERVITLLHGIYPQENVFCLGNLRFAIFVGPCAPASTLVERAHERMERLTGSKRSNANCVLGLKVAQDVEEMFREHEANVIPFFHIVQYPDFIKSVDEFEAALQFGLEAPRDPEGGRVSIATRDSLDARQREAAVLAAVRKAITNNGFTLNYQPILRVADGRFASAEVLIRLIDDELGFIPPDEFIPLAESNGLAPLISDYVVEETCRFWHDNQLAEKGLDYLELNLSATDFVRDNLADKLLDTMARYDVAPTSINFEITETSATGIGDNLFTLSMERMAKEGVKFSVDDFGSGFASINYLIQVPAELVKVDKGILWAAMEDKDAFTVLETTMSLLHQLGKHSLCEGVETEAMASMLRNMGCEYFQGYLYSKPLKPAEYLAFLEAHR